MYPRNAASPPSVLIGEVVQISDGAVQTTGVSVRVKTGSGAWGAGAGTLACDTTSGVWEYTPTQAETNGDTIKIAIYKSACLGASATLVTTAEATAGTVKLGASQTTDIIGTLSGSVGSVTGNVGGNVVGSVASVTGGINTGAGTITTLDELNDPSAEAIADAVWDEATSGHATAGTTGKALTDVLGDTNELQTNQGNWLTATGFSTHSAADVWSVTTRVLTAATNLTSDGSAITMSSAGVVGTVDLVNTTTTNTDMRGTDSAYTGTPPSVAAIVDGVWDEMTSGHSTAGTTGKALTDAGSAGDPWSTALPGAYTGSQAGKVLADVLDDVTGLDGSAMRGTDSAYTGTPPSAAAISAQVAADLATAHGAGSWQTATGFAVAGSAMTLTAAYDAAKTAAQAGDRMDLVDAPNATAVAAVQDGLSTFDASTDEVNLAADQSGVTVGTVNALAANSITSSVLATDCITSGKIATDAIGASELSAAAINAIQSGLATAANQVTILTNQTTIAEYIDTEVAAVKAVTDKLDDTLEDDLGTYRFTANALEQAPSGGGGGLTQQQVRDAMKLAPTAGDPAAGSVDAHLDDIVEDTGMTLPAAISAIDAGTGSGAHSVTATVNDGTNPVQNARVTYKLNGMTVATGVTDDEGVAPAFSLDSATYTVVITASGYTFTSTTHAVSGDATPTYSMTAINITPSANADMTTVYFTARDISGNALAGESFSYRQVGNVTGSGNAFEVDAGTATSDADGLVFIAMYKGAAYLLYRGSGEPVTIRIASDAESTTELGNILI